MTTGERDAVAEDMVPVVRRLARKRAGVIDAEELESVGMSALADALDGFDPDRGQTPRQYAAAVVQLRMIDAIRAAGGGRRGRERAAKLPHVRPFATDPATGEELVPADRRADDPAALASARERLAALCDPAAAANKAAALRQAMFDAVTPADIGDVVRGLVGRAKASDRSAKLLLTLVGAAGPAPAPTVIPVRAEDVS